MALSGLAKTESRPKLRPERKKTNTEQRRPAIVVGNQFGLGLKFGTDGALRIKRGTESAERENGRAKGSSPGMQEVRGR
ncbi:hypothetical protein N7462_006228 [Penicillium macrosclerotiorum]|uniref:uncharacterized protein n=1 Tax=Penicillium macrosclerotiorum TaxID=303699 RepID=UPI002547AE97|nr:uncharacterized protein N7462_006228 [Penicillium macrosclerotiorum]KAJ5683063.1 hypothetical protein N7462_006228 [Penicillium macrosclerotiorum]